MGDRKTATIKPQTDWFVAGAIVSMHAIALAAPFHYSPGGLAVFIGLTIITGFGVTVGYHRLLTHGSFQTVPWVRYSLTVAGLLSGQGGPLQWVSDHRCHHKYSDVPGMDPHTPRDRFWHSHVLWTLVKRGDPRPYYSQFAPDLLTDPTIVLIDSLFLPLNFALAAILALVGGWSWLVWGLAVRMVWGWHWTWCVNSLSHKFGYRNYETRDDSTNLWWLAFLTYGEANHNNHHAFPVAANHGRRWFEFDPSYRLIQLLDRAGLAWKVVKA